MTEAERKLAKLSRTMNNTLLATTSNNETDEKAYLSTINHLQSTIISEKNRISKDKNNFNLSVQAKFTEETLRNLACKHHSKVLEAQIQENQLKKHILNESESKIPSYYSFRTEIVPEKNLKLKDDLLSQIKAKEEQRKLEINKDLEFSKRSIEISNKKLQEEYDLRAQMKENAFKDMISSWEENKKLKELQKKLEKFVVNGPRPEGKAEFCAEGLEVQEKQPVSQEPQPKQRKIKSVDRAFNWKSTLRSISVKTGNSRINGKSFNGIIERFGKLSIKEKKLKKDKEDILDYFKRKNKLQGKSDVPKLPKLSV